MRMFCAIVNELKELVRTTSKENKQMLALFRGYISYMVTTVTFEIEQVGSSSSYPAKKKKKIR